MSISWEKLVASMAVSVVVSGLLTTPLNALTVAIPYETPVTSTSTPAVPPSSTSTTSTAEGVSVAELALEKWLDKLAWVESGNRAHIKHLDVNGRYSYGCLQFQMATFKAYSLQYGLVQPGADFSSLIYNCKFQRTVAKHMIKENPKHASHWGYSVWRKGVGAPPSPAPVVLVD